MRIKLLLAAASLLASTAGGLSYVSGHSTGRESRSVADCQKLPMPERQACLSCVGRPLKHHYHPDYPFASRCRPDNGKP
jgi:hypothetical protein